MIGHTVCSEEESEDTEVAIPEKELVLLELCVGTMVTFEVDGALEEEEGGGLGRSWVVLTEVAVEGAAFVSGAPDVPSAEPSAS